MKIAVIVSRIIVGSLFIISGLIKANDAIGFEYKLVEYFSEKALGLPDLIPIALPLAIFICVGEILLGAALLLGAYPKLTNALLMFMLLFFAWLTYYTATCDPFTEIEFVNELGETYMATPECVLECGCFGNAIPLTPWESFWKDMILLFFGIFTFIGAFITKHIKLNSAKEDIVMLTGCLVFSSLFSLLMLDWLFPILFSGLLVGIGILVKKYSNRNQLLMALALIIVVGYFQCRTLNHLPVKDYRPYAIGQNITEGMKSAEELGLEPPVYITMYELTDKNTGEVQEMDSKTYIADKIWQNKDLEITKSWGPIKEKDGYEPPIPPDFEFTNLEGDIVTEELLQGDDLVFLQISYDLTTGSTKHQSDINDLAKKAEAAGHRVYGLTSSGMDEIEDFRHDQQSAFPFYIGDEKILKTIVRSNPGLVVLKGGTVINKYHHNDIPDFDEAIQRNFQP